MRSLFVIFSAMLLTFFVIPAGAQGHAEHHPQQESVAQVDTGMGQGMMGGKMTQGMMQGRMMGMMGTKAMGCPMCGQKMQGRMMGMMSGMMEKHEPMHRFVHTVHHLPDMKVKLGLSDKQVEQLKELRADFLKRRADWNAAIEKHRIDLGMLLNQETTVAKLRKVLKSISDVELDMKVALYEASQKMIGLLSKEQKEKWRSMGAMGKGGQMMQHMMRKK